MSSDRKKAQDLDTKAVRALQRWADAERAYTAAIEPFSIGVKPLGHKNDVIAIVRLRVQADQLRDKYVKRCRAGSD